MSQTTAVAGTAAAGGAAAAVDVAVGAGMAQTDLEIGVVGEENGGMIFIVYKQNVEIKFSNLSLA